MRWKLVPVEPTEEMLDACDFVSGSWDDHEDVYSTAVAAAPKASQDEELVEKVAKAIMFDAESRGGISPMNAARAVLKMLEGGE